MTRRKQIALGLIVLVALAAVFGGVAWWRHVRRGAQPLNVLLITLDTTRADRLGCYGYRSAATPAVDQLAAQGTLFEKAYATVPLTLPSHATILTGLLPPEHGLIRNAEGALAKSIPTLATVLQEQGYATGAFVAANVLEGKYGLSRGFDTYDDQLPAAVTVGTAEDPYRPANTVADPAIAWIRNNAAGPFFAWVHFFDAHSPYYLHEDVFGQKFRENPYDAGIAFADLHVARLLRTLEELGIRGRTLVVVVGDHGESLNGEHNEPRPYHGYMLYNSTLHAPLIFSLPGTVSSGRRVPQPVSLVDLYATLTEFLRLPVTPQGRGVSLLPALRGQAIAGHDCYAETAYPAVYGCRPQQSLIGERWHYIRSPQAELYDMRADPAELRNLAPVESGQLGAMESALAKMEQGMARHQADAVQLSAEDRRRLESLGYVGGSAPASPAVAQALTRDIKGAVAAIALGMRAEELAGAGHRAEAVGLWRQAGQDCPDCLTFRNSLAATLMDQRDYAAAEQELRPLLADLKARLGGTGARIGKDETLYPVVAHNLALTLAYLGRFQEALPLVQEAVALSPDVSAMHFTLANVYERLGQRREALAAGNKAASLGHTYPDCIALLAELELQVGDKGRAVILAQAVLDGKDVQETYRVRAAKVLEALRAPAAK